MIIAGDVGGTKTRLALYSRQNSGLTREFVKQYQSKAFPRFRDMVRQFVEESRISVDTACFGVPGPVIDGAVNVTNLPWQISETELSTALGIRKIKLVNDLVATASGVPHIDPKDLVTLHEGRPVKEKKVMAVIAPGTGAGHGFLHFVDGVAHAVASEGGHADFAPTNELEIQLLQYLLKKYTRASYERVICGPGLVNVYNFLKDSGFAKESDQVAERMNSEDPAAVISCAGIEGKDELCIKALDIFASVLGSQAGNLVLTFMATSGAYLGGGIPPKILPKLQDGTTVGAYLHKGRLSDVVMSTPLYVIMDDFAALLGAAHIADAMAPST